MIEIYSHAQFLDRPDRAHQLFSQRYEIFVQRLGWALPTRGYYEFDQFDDDSAVYILRLDDQGQLCGSCRVLPTTGSYMLSGVFRSLLGTEEAPHSSGILELSRFCIDTKAGPGAAPGRNCRVTTELFAAVVDYSLRQSATDVLAVVNLPILRIIRRLIGGEPEWRGPLRDLNGTRCVAIRFPVTDWMLARLHDQLRTPLVHADATESRSVMRAA